MKQNKYWKRFLAGCLMLTLIFTLPNAQTLAETESSGEQTGYTELTFSDYAIEDGRYVVGNCLQKKPLTGLSSLNGVAFNGKVKFESGGGINDGFRIGGIQNGWEGVFGILYADGGIYLWDYMKKGDALFHVPASQLKENPLETEVAIRMTFDFVETSDVRITLSIDGKQYYEETLVGYQSLMGTFLMVSATTVPVTVKSTNIDEIENTFTEITFSDYNVSNGPHEVGTANIQNKVTGLTDLDRVAFTGKMTFTEGAEPYNNGIRIGGVSAWPGLGIFYADRGIYLWDHIVTNRGLTHVPSSKLAVNPLQEAVTVRLMFKYVGATDVALTFQVDDIFYSVILEGYQSKMGLYMLVSSTTASTTLESVYIEKPRKHPIVTDLPEIMPTDFGVADDTYAYTDSNGDDLGESAVDGQLQWNYYMKSNLDTVIGKTFSANVKFGGKDEQLRIGGSDASEHKEWSGLMFAGTNQGFYICETESKKQFGKQRFDFTTAGISSVTEEFNLKLSFEAEDNDGDGVKDDLKLGVWFNNKLYNDTYFHIEGYAVYLGNHMLIYCPNEGGTLQIKSEPLTPYIVEDFMLKRQTQIDFSGSSISGKVALKGTGSIDVYGCRLYLQNDKLKMRVGETQEIILTDMTEGEEFSFVVTEKILDADADGTKDDVRFGIGINGDLSQNRYCYLLNARAFVETAQGVVVNHAEEVSLSDSVNIEHYNLANVDTESGYLITGEGKITANGVPMQNGDLISQPGDYIVRCEGQGAYVKYVSIYQAGDAHVDNALDVKDLVATKKAMNKNRAVTIATLEGADVNADNIVNAADVVHLQECLIGLKEWIPIADNQVSFEKDVMPIVGYFGPYRETASATESGNHEETYYDYVTDSVYSQIQQVGINLIGRSQNDYLSFNDKDEILDGLALAEKYDIGVLVNDERLKNIADAKIYAEALQDFSRYDSYKGLSIVDEPFTSYYGAKYYEERKLESYAGRSTVANYYHNTLGYINLNGMGKHLASEDVLIEMYDRYLEEYINTCNPKIISWDYYVFDEEIYGKNHYWTTEGYFKNLQVIRQKSKKYNLPFWSYVQAGSNWRENTNDDSKWVTNDNVPTKGQLLWNANTALAYGAKGIQYFPLIQPYWFAYGGLTDDTYDNFERNGLIAADGTTTKWYDYAQEANVWIAKVDEVLMNATNEAVLVVGNTAQRETGISDSIAYEELQEITASNGAVVGVFSYQGKPAYYVVNYDTSDKQTITLRFDKEKQYSCHIQGAEEVVSETKVTCSFSVEAGNAALVVINE